MQSIILSIAAIITSHVLVSCGARPFTSSEQQFLNTIHKPRIDYSKARIKPTKLLKEKVLARVEQEKLTYRGNEKSLALINAQSIDKYLANKPDAVVIGNTIFYNPAYYKSNFVPHYPNFVNWQDANLFAHEATHVWQQQNAELTGYSIIKAILEHIRYKDPYKYDLIHGKKFLEYRYEQQGKMIQDYVSWTYDNLPYWENRRLKIEALLKELHSSRGNK